MPFCWNAISVLPQYVRSCYCLIAVSFCVTKHEHSRVCPHALFMWRVIDDVNINENLFDCPTTHFLILLHIRSFGHKSYMIQILN